MGNRLLPSMDQVILVASRRRIDDRATLHCRTHSGNTCTIYDSSANATVRSQGNPRAHRTNRLVARGEVWVVHPLGALCNPGRNMERSAGRGHWRVDHEPGEDPGE